MTGPRNAASSSEKVPSATSPHPTGVISRSISACNRCRARKTKCDQLFPSCTACTRVGADCVGVDAATGKEIPRSHVHWLERRVEFLEKLFDLKPGEGGLGENQERERDENHFDGERRGSVTSTESGKRLKRDSADMDLDQDAAPTPPPALRRPSVPTGTTTREPEELRLRPDIENLIDQVGVVGVEGTSATGFMGSSSGFSYARLLLTSVNVGTEKDRTSSHLVRDPKAPPRASPPDTSITSTMPLRKRTQAIPFPMRDRGQEIISIYFEQANPQYPILHRPSFFELFERVCDREESNFTLLKGTEEIDRIKHSADLYLINICFAIASAMSQTSGEDAEGYHASAMEHFEDLFSSISLTNNRLDGLKGILLLALYSLMRPATPGVWYVVGSALRLAVDLGLHQEKSDTKRWNPLELDERRRLFWCTYCLDRQVCVYIGRPFGISDDAISTPFPVEVSDEYITTEYILRPAFPQKSSRTISLLMFRIRQLQSEIQKVLYQLSELPRRFLDVNNWMRDIERRLYEWYESAPKSQSETGSGYNLGFIDLNYQQTRLLLYGLSPKIPRPTEDHLGHVADSGSRIIIAYKELQEAGKINYTWLACHNLFIAGTSYLCAIWHSRKVRSETSLETLDLRARICIRVLDSMIARCPAAKICVKVFKELADSTIKLCQKERERVVLCSSQAISQRHQQRRIQAPPAKERAEVPNLDISPPPPRHSSSTPNTQPFSPQFPRILQTHQQQQHPSYQSPQYHFRQQLQQQQTHIQQITWTPSPSDDNFSPPLAGSASSGFSHPPTPPTPPFHLATTTAASQPPGYVASEISPTTTAPGQYGQNTPWIDMGPQHGGQMQPLMDGLSLHEMIKEVGTVGTEGLSWGVDGAFEGMGLGGGEVLVGNVWSDTSAGVERGGQGQGQSQGW